jgi:hypothetical protein
MKPLLLVRHKPNETHFENENVLIKRVSAGIYFYAKDVEGHKMFYSRTPKFLPYFIAYETASYILVALIGNDNQLSNAIYFSEADSRRLNIIFIANDDQDSFNIKLSSFQKKQEICVLFPKRIGDAYQLKRHIIHFEQASPLLNIINNQLTKKCPELSLDIDYNSWLMPLLCMRYKNKCISFVRFSHRGLSDPILEISTQTREPFGNHKYNILLRGVAIILAHSMYLIEIVKGVKIIQPYTTICSYAINPISVYILVHYYGGYFQDPEIANKFANTALSAKSLFAKITDLYYPKNRRNNITVTVFVDLKNINHVMTTVKTLLAGPVRCIGNGTRKKMRTRSD